VQAAQLAKPGDDHSQRGGQGQMLSFRAKEKKEGACVG